MEQRRAAAALAVVAAALGPALAGCSGGSPHPTGASGSGPAAGSSGSTVAGPEFGPRPTPFRVHYLEFVGDGGRTRIWPVDYRAHDGRVRRAYVALPRWYGPKRHPALPLVLSPHGRGVTARANLRHYWGDLPALGGFALVSPDGQGRRLGLFSWGYPGQIADLARMPQIVARALPWLRIDRRRIYSVGGSMGGQETLLLVARYPRLLAGAAAFDSPTNMAARYRAFPQLVGGRGLQALARYEFGGMPAQVPGAYAERSPQTYARGIAFSGVPLQLWWSTRDRIVTSQNTESGLLYREIKRINPSAPVTHLIGTWPHSTEMRPLTLMPLALERLGLLRLPDGIEIVD